MSKQLGEGETLWDAVETKFAAQMKAEGIDPKAIKNDALKQTFIDGAMYNYADEMSDPKDRQAVLALAQKHFEGTGRSADEIYDEWKKSALV